ncbi:hypothetical protein JD844_007497 [Phrynosoma platyrhinos]|uniref:Myeloid leukemia factor 1 n=1 Tax=Phrynosoma platyrhinos TaxID=52577 RepID=A0ABQ7T3S8_PHRPL|nr:hypothetical protein JD844_007497 [Phrynosoma platyrhinos]
MFGGLSRVFEEDPFFRDPFAAHNEHVRHFFSEPFGHDPFFAIKDDGKGSMDQRGRPDSQVALRGNDKAMSCSLMPFGSFGGMHNMDFRSPFSVMDRMMSNMRNNMMELQRNFIKETRKALKDSESGLEKMAIGHHIQDRAHVVQKAKNNKTGDEELNQEFVNLDETEAHAFNEQWQKEIQKFKPSLGRNNIDVPRHRSIQHVGREDAVRREKMHSRMATDGPRKPKSSLEKLSVKGSHVPLKASKK